MGRFIMKRYFQGFLRTQVTVVFAVVVIVWLQSYNTLLEYHSDHSVVRTYEGRKESNSNLYKDIPFFFVMCKGRNEAMTSEKMLQARMMLKSAAALTNQVLKFTIFSDTKSIYDDIMSSVNLWPLEFQHKLQVDFHPVSYPVGTEDFRAACKPCATFRLLFADVMTHIDAAAYVDTDVIFMQSPENMLKEFDNFDNFQVAGFAEPSFVYMKQLQKRFGLPGTSGINTGVALFNFTRMRSLPGDNFTQTSMDIFNQYRKKITHGDQHILFVFFRKFPSLLYVLGCEWNYYNGLCFEIPSNCREADTNGVSLVHGGGGSFNTDLKFIFTAWEEYELGEPIQELIKKIEINAEKYKSSCKATNITSIITKKLT